MINTVIQYPSFPFKKHQVSYLRELLASHIDDKNINYMDDEDVIPLIHISLSKNSIPHIDNVINKSEDPDVSKFFQNCRDMLLTETVMGTPEYISLCIMVDGI